MKASVRHGVTRPGEVSPPVWDKEAYAVIEDGPILVRAMSTQGPERVRNFSRWSLRVECMAMFDPVSLSLFLNFAGDAVKPGRPGRQSKYYKHWMMANGEPPKKDQVMSWNIFPGKCFMAYAEKRIKNAKGELKTEVEKYSVLTHFIRREPSYEVEADVNQESKKSGIMNHESTNQAINQSSRPVSGVGSNVSKGFASARRR